MIYHKLKYFTISLFIIVFFSSCVTKALWDIESKYDYKDNINKFFVDEKGKRVIFLGDSFHYIFPFKNKNNQDIALVMHILNNIQDRSSLLIDIDNSWIKVLNKKDNIRCNILLKSDLQKVKMNQVGLFSDLGFTKEEDPNFLVKRIILEGKIYRASEEFRKNLKSLNNSYRLKIYSYDTHWKEDISKIALTPLSLATDVAITFVGLSAGAFLKDEGYEQDGQNLMEFTLRTQMNSLKELLSHPKKENSY